MAISKNFLLKQVSGHLGKQLVLKQYGDKVVMTAYPDMSRRKLSSKQIRTTEIMEEAVYKVKYIISNDELRNAAQLRLNVTRNKLYHALISEHFKETRKE